VKLLCLLLLLVVLACGCGGNSGHLYSLEKTSACLRQDGVQLGRPVGDFIASTSTGGSTQAHFDSNFVTLVFSEDVDKADNINQIYHRVRAKNVGIEDVLRQDHNVVMLWHSHPSDADLARITACLK